MDKGNIEACKVYESITHKHIGWRPMIMGELGECHNFVVDYFNAHNHPIFETEEIAMEFYNNLPGQTKEERGDVENMGLNCECRYQIVPLDEE